MRTFIRIVGRAKIRTRDLPNTEQQYFATFGVCIPEFISVFVSNVQSSISCWEARNHIFENKNVKAVPVLIRHGMKIMWGSGGKLHAFLAVHYRTESSELDIMATPCKPT